VWSVRGIGGGVSNMSDTKKLELLPSIADCKFWLYIPLKELTKTQIAEIISILAPRSMSWQNNHELYVEFKTISSGNLFIEAAEKIMNGDD
tara:strand:+ start:458 stop:730 length:273 start_codon:yes stop_codon:yes gene_type:complete